MKFISTLILLIFMAITAFAGGDETAKMQEKEFAFKDFTYKNLRDGKDVNLREFARNKKLVLVVYYAAWCPNWRNEQPLVKKLYDKYKDQGFDVIAVSEYDTLDNAKKDRDSNNLGFTIVSESEAQDAKQKTKHYEMRKAAGDTRNWGSPWNVFLETAKIEPKGDVLTAKTFVVNGEMIETEVEAFIRQKLGLTSENKQAALNSITEAAPEACQEPALKKP